MKLTRYQIYTRSPEWARKKREFLETRFNGKCAACQSTDGPFEVTHKSTKDRANFSTVGLDALTAVCPSCKKSFGPAAFGQFQTRLSEEEVEKVEEMLSRGLRLKQAADKLGRGYATIEKIAFEFGISVKPTPEYERQEIPYEFKTELPMLLNMWGLVSIDEPHDEGDKRSLHNRLSSSDMNPLEHLIMKEEREEREREEMISEYAQRIAHTRKRIKMEPEIHHAMHQFSIGHKK